MTTTPTRTSQQRAADKRAFYRQPGIAATYDQQRFGSPSGEWVNRRELSEIGALLPPTGRVLDLGCGTGRLSRWLTEKGRDVVMVDASDAMLAHAVPTVGAPAVLADAFSLPFKQGAFDVVVALRVAFHFNDIAALITSVAPTLAPGGRFIFDTYRWTPRAALALASQRWGGKVYTHSSATVTAAAQAAGLRVARHHSCFLFSPYLYRLLPLAAVRGLESAEAHVPESARVRVFWALERATSGGDEGEC